MQHRFLFAKHRHPPTSPPLRPRNEQPSPVPTLSRFANPSSTHRLAVLNSCLSHSYTVSLLHRGLERVCVCVCVYARGWLCSVRTRLGAQQNGRSGSLGKPRLTRNTLQLPSRKQRTKDQYLICTLCSLSIEQFFYSPLVLCTMNHVTCSRLALIT